MRSRSVTRNGASLRMLTTVKFNREPQRRTIKIQNKTTGWMLAAKVSAELSISKPLPETHFDVREIAPKLSCAGGFNGSVIKA